MTTIKKAIRVKRIRTGDRWLRFLCPLVAIATGEILCERIRRDVPLNRKVVAQTAGRTGFWMSALSVVQEW